LSLATVAQDGSLRLWALGHAGAGTIPPPRPAQPKASPQQALRSSPCEGQPKPLPVSIPAAQPRAAQPTTSTQQRSRAIPNESERIQETKELPKCDTVAQWKAAIRPRIAELFQERSRVSLLAVECDNFLASIAMGDGGSSELVAQVSEIYDNAIRELQQRRQQKAQAAKADGESAMLKELQFKYTDRLEESRQLGNIIPALQAAMADPSTPKEELERLEQMADEYLAQHHDFDEEDTGQGCPSPRASATTPMPQAGAPGSSEWVHMIASPPEAPPECSASGCGADWIKLAWVPPASHFPVTAYEVRQMGPDNTYSTVHHGSPSTTTCVACDLDSSTRYVFGVRAWNQAAAGPWRNCCGSTAAAKSSAGGRFPMEGLEKNSFGKSGIIYWIGTRQGQESSWINPVHSGEVRSTASSKAGGTPRNLVSRSLAKFCTEDEEGSWFALQFLQYEAKLEGYAMRMSAPCGNMSPGVQYSPRNWVLEGSTNGEAWDVLREHVDDDGLCHDPQACWKIEPPQLSYSHFRVRMTGPNARRSDSLLFAYIGIYCTHVYTHTGIHTHRNTYTKVYVYTCITYMYTYMHACTHTRTHT